MKLQSPLQRNKTVETLEKTGFCISNIIEYYLDGDANRAHG